MHRLKMKKIFNINIPIQRSQLCVGDRIHNELCELLINATPKNISKDLFNWIETYCTEYDFQWIHFFLTKTDIKRLCNILNSKSEEIFEKRWLSFYESFWKSPYKVILDKDKIHFIEFLHSLKDKIYKTDKHIS